MKRKNYLLRFIIVIVIIAVVVGIVINRGWIYDFWRGKFYVSSYEMARIKNDLNLTEQGEFLFDATWPELNSDDEFNRNCRADDEENAVLGCYINGNIYIYNIVEEELDGIRELTTAHELLHAVYARMSDDEKEKLRPSLEKAYKNNREVFERDLKTYSEGDRFEELYVRAGTEIKNLPKDLEEHYAEIFRDQDSIVGFYEKYIVVFREIEEEMDELTKEMEAIQKSVDKKTVEYDTRISKLNMDIGQFNKCANTVGCFGTEYEFNMRRNSLLAEQETLETLYNEINDLIDEYNEMVKKYNDDVIRTEKLNQVINSSIKPEDVNNL